MTGAAALPQPTLGARLRRLLAIAWIFAVAGPPIGTVVFMLVTAVIGMGRGVDVAGLSWVALFSLIYGVPFGYLIGVMPALASGLLVGVRQAWFGPAPLWFAVAAGILVGVGFLIATGRPLWHAADAETDPAQFSALIVLTTTLATLCCWAMVRHWHLVPPGRERAP